MHPIQKSTLGVINFLLRSWKPARFCSNAAIPHENKWDLIGALVVERKPVITKELEDIEKKFSALLLQLEYEKSLKSDHEITDELEKKEAELVKKGKIKDIDLDAVVKQTAQDFRDVCSEELAKFQFAPRTTEDDQRNDQKSLKRHLDGHLLLFIEQQVGDRFKWVVPQTAHREGEALHETAMRALGESCGQQLKVRMLGHAPWGFYKYKYPREVKTKGAMGAKIFFFKATHIAGQVQLVPGHNKDFKWVESSSVLDMKPSGYSDSISQFMLSCRR